MNPNLRTPRSIRIGVALVAMLAVGNALYKGAYTPARDRWRKLEALEADLVVAQQKTTANANAKTELAKTEARCVSSNPSHVSMFYQEWLLAVTQQLQLQRPIIKPGRAVRFGNVGHRVPLTIHARMSTQQLGSLLDHVEQTEGLHRISDVSVQVGKSPAAGGKLESASEHRARLYETVVKIEALALPRANLDDDAMQVLRPEPRLAESLGQGQHFERFVEPTQQTEVRSQTEVRTQTKHVAINVFAQVRLLATFARDGKRQAWFVDQQTNQEYVVDASRSALQIGEQSCEVQEIGRDYVQLSIAGVARRVELGEEIQKPTRSL